MSISRKAGFTQEGELRGAFVVHRSPEADLEPERTEIDTAIMPAGVYKTQDGGRCLAGTHFRYFPVGSGASYLRHVPHYEKKVFVCDFGGVWLVGWYYVRHVESAAANTAELNLDEYWQKLWKQDTRINTSQIVLRARDDQGEFIRGKVWLGLFSLPSILINYDSLRYGVPNRITHHNGWDVPSFALTLGWWNNRAAHGDGREPHPMPNHKDLAKISHAATVPLPPPFGREECISSGEKGEKRDQEMILVPHRYVQIQPKEGGVQIPVAYHVCHE